MGAQLSTIAPTATVPIDAYIAELGDLTYSGDLGRSRFLKTVRATHRDGFAVVKVFIRPPTDQLDITQFKNQVQNISAVLRRDQGPLNSFPHAIGYSRIVESERAGYLVRQYIKHNLYDRISTRPFLEPVEKRWIAYQLLRALQSFHEHGIKHGDIKSENVLVGSWKWIYLSDFAPFKPVSIPEDDTAQFLFYFDVSQRRVCYVAPERFADNGPTELTAEMDIYSTGCVIAELFMDGQPLFSLADLFKYKRSEWAPEWSSISEDKAVQELVMSMVSVDPAQRKSAAEYLEMYKDTLFPSYFDVLWKLLVPYSSSAGATSSNAMIQHLWTHFKSEVLVNGLKIYDDLELVSKLPSSALPVVIPLPPDYQYILPRSRHISRIPADGGALIVLSYVCSSLTATSSVEWRRKAAYLLLILAEFVPDDAKLDRCLPYLVLLLRDSQMSIRVTALPLITHLISMVKTYSPLNAKVFTAYIFPRISQTINSKPSAELRAMLALCLPTLAECAVECEGWDAVVPFVNDITRLLLVDKVGIVRRSLLSNADTLCSVLRKQGTNDVILLHAITYLNDKDPYVRMDLFCFIAKVAPLVGIATIEQYVAPLMMQSLCDPREDIVTLILRSMAAIVDLGLIRLKPLLTSIIPFCVKFLIHPNVNIRTQTLILVANAAKHLTPAQQYCLLRPQLSRYVVGDVESLTDYGSLAESLKAPISQAVYSLTLRWAANATKTRFWSYSNQPRLNQSAMSNSSIFTEFSASSAATFSHEDKRWFSSLREIGFNNEDLWQLIVYREYIWQLSRVPVHSNPIPSELEHKDSVGDISTPQSVIDNEPVVVSVTLPNNSQRLSSKKGLTSWTVGRTIPPGLSTYVQAHRFDDTTENTEMTIGGKIFTKPYILNDVTSSDANSFTNESSASSSEILPRLSNVENTTTNNNAGSVGARGIAMAVASAKSRARGDYTSGTLKPTLNHQFPSILVSSMKAHRGAINVLTKHDNNRHFVTAADDGLIKLWDIRLLLKGSSKPVDVFETSTFITACEFLADTSILVFGTGEGKVGFLKYSFETHENGSALVYNGYTLIDEFSIDGNVVAFHCTDSMTVASDADTFSGVITHVWLLTSTGFVLKVCLETLKVEEKLEIPQEHGSPTCWQWDSDGDWMVVGTLHGMLDLFDMRFLLHVNSFGIGDLQPITAIDSHPMRERLLCVAGGFRRNIITVWDIEKVECREILIPVSDLDDIENDTELPSLEPIVSSATLNERFAKWDISETVTSRPKPPVTTIMTTKRLGSHWLLSGGGDRILRLWDLRSPYQSVAISGYNYNKGKLSYLGKVGSHIRYTYESWSAIKGGTERLSRNAVISKEEQDIGRNHRGCITKVAILELSSGRDVTVSVDEIGIVKLFS